MSEITMLRGSEPRKILQTVIEKKIPAIMSYLSKGKWHVAKVSLNTIGASVLSVEVSPRKKPHPINIKFDQPVGLSLKYGYGKFIFEVKVVGFEPSNTPTGGGTILLTVPDKMEIVQRRSYFRVEVPKSLEVNVMLWHRRFTTANHGMQPEHCWEGRLIDISAGGAQIAIDASEKSSFRKGQFIGLRFTPMPYETPLILNAQIRDVLPTANDKNVCLGLQLVGLEATAQGRQVLMRLTEVVEQYYQINQSGVKQQDLQTTGL